MNLLTRIFRAVTGARADDREIKHLARARGNAIAAANQSGGTNWTGVQSEYNEDAFNQDYLTALGTVQQRSQDLDANNPDIGGWHRTRTAQIIGAGVKFKFAPRADEVGLSEAQLKDLAAKVDRARELHSLLGGFDSTGRGRGEGKQQERAVLTMLIYGSVLIHRVGRSDERAQIRSFSLELIPGCRISTPYEKYGDPLVSYGVQYTDPHRTRVTGYWVRRVSTTVGNSFVPDFKWDFLPVEDCAYLAMTEAAGLDRELPACVRVIRQARNRGEFVEAAVESARAQADHYAAIQCAPKASPYAVAADDSKQIYGTNFTRLGNGVKVLYQPAGEKIEFLSSKLPEPDFKGFSDVIDSRMSRGLVTSKSTFTRQVESSWASGRSEQQQDDPIINQIRRSFLDAWHRVGEWFTESLWLEDVVELPGYSSATQHLWSQYRATFPGKVSINPQQTMSAREQAYALRSQNPYQAAEEDGTDAEEQAVLWAKWTKFINALEEKEQLKPGTLAILLSGKAMTTSAGDQVAPPAPTQTDPAEGDAVGAARDTQGWTGKTAGQAAGKAEISPDAESNAEDGHAAATGRGDARRGGTPARLPRCQVERGAGAVQGRKGREGRPGHPTGQAAEFDAEEARDDLGREVGGDQGHLQALPDAERR